MVFCDARNTLNQCSRIRVFFIPDLSESIGRAFLGISNEKNLVVKPNFYRTLAGCNFSSINFVQVILKYGVLVAQWVKRWLTDLVVPKFDSRPW